MKCRIPISRFLPLVVFTAMLPSCAFLPAFTQEEYARREREEMEGQYAPYKQLNSIEGYREFVRKYPHNFFLEAALDNIDNLEFAPYEKTDTMAAYEEFVARYPNNRHAVAAKSRIDQAAIKECENADTIPAYRRFLKDHPDNIFAQTAQDRLQDLEFRELASAMQQQCGFDLLMYRLHNKRLQNDLPAVCGIGLGDFTLFASLDTIEGKRCFTTQLIYSADLDRLARATAPERQQIFDGVVTKLIAGSAQQFAGAKGFDVVSFAFSSSPYRFHGDARTALEFTMPAREARLFAQSRNDAAQLLGASTVRQTVPAPVTAHAAVKPDGRDIMQKSAALRPARDYTMSATWSRVLKNGTVQTVKTTGKWKDFSGAGGYASKYATSYVHSQNDKYAAAILSVLDTGGTTQYWYIFSKGDPGRTTDIENYRPPAERDFPLNEFWDIPVPQERHQYAGPGACETGQCYIVDSTPLGSAPYEKRKSFIDQGSLLPVKVDYYDRSGALWKTAGFQWQNSGGAWFWKQAVIENAQSGSKTTIDITDVKANTGLAYSDFTPPALMRYSR